MKLKALSPLSVLESLSCSFTSYSNFAGNYPSFAVGEKGGTRARMGVREAERGMILNVASIRFLGREWIRA